MWCICFCAEKRGVPSNMIGQGREGWVSLGFVSPHLLVLVNFILGWLDIAACLSPKTKIIRPDRQILTNLTQ